MSTCRIFRSLSQIHNECLEDAAKYLKQKEVKQNAGMNKDGAKKRSEQMFLIGTLHSVVQESPGAYYKQQQRWNKF